MRIHQLGRCSLLQLVHLRSYQVQGCQRLHLSKHQHPRDRITECGGCSESQKKIARTVPQHNGHTDIRSKCNDNTNHAPCKKLKFQKVTSYHPCFCQVKKELCTQLHQRRSRVEAIGFPNLKPAQNIEQMRCHVQIRPIIRS